MSETKTVNKRDLTKEQNDFLFGNLWKVVIKMMIPTVIMMLVFGIYSFSDTILAIQFAPDSYPKIANGLSAPDQVRTFMGAIAPVNMFMMGIMFMFATGVSTRVAVNMGAGRTNRAIDTFKAGTSIAMLTSVILIPILIFATKPWIESTISDPLLKSWVADNSFKYALPLIIGLPFQLFSQLLTSIFRTEGRNKEMMVAMVFPIFLNLAMDVILMGPAGMDISGGAWASSISFMVSTLMYIVFILRNKNTTIIKFKNMFGFKLKYITLIGIFLVGLGAFFSSFGQSLTVSLEATVIQDVSVHAYQGMVANSPIMAGASGAQVTAASSLIMYTQMQAMMPIFMLVFPIVFSLGDAIKPVASFNYGAGNIKRAKKTTFVSLTYILGISIVLYFIIAFGLKGPLFDALSFSGSNLAPTTYDDATKSLWIMLSVLITVGPLVASQIWFGSTDKIIGNVISSSLWFLSLIPFLFVFKTVGLNSDVRYIFWAIYPTIGAFGSVVAITWMLISMKLHKTTNMDIEQKIIAIQRIVKKPREWKTIIKEVKSDKTIMAHKS